MFESKSLYGKESPATADLLMILFIYIFGTKIVSSSQFYDYAPLLYPHVHVSAAFFLFLIDDITLLYLESDRSTANRMTI